MHNPLNDTALIQKHTDFEQEYLALRGKEGRLYSDKELQQLPLISETHHLKKEWRIRAGSCKRLANYFLRQNKPLRILEIGCGNGWFSNQLAGIRNVQVVGMDINKMELEQAKRVFTKANLHFIYGDIRTSIFKEKFDVIIFAASFQYFKPVGEILDVCLEQLKEAGEIHLVDTPFYALEDGIYAKERSEKYFNSSGAPAMKGYYFHHTMEDLGPYKYKILFNPKSLFNKLFKINPFPWICITN